MKRRANELTAEERAAFLAQLRRAPAPEPQPLPTWKAKDLSAAERQEWLREHIRRWG